MDLRNFGLSDDDLAALGYRVSPTGQRDSLGGSDPGGTHSYVGPEGQVGSVRHPGRRRSDAVRTWFWTLVVLVGAVWFGRPSQRMSAPVPANQPDTVFSSGRAMSQLVEIARAPRPLGSPEHDRVVEYLLDRLGQLGLETELRTSSVGGSDGSEGAVAAVRHVLARRPGSAPTGALALTTRSDGGALSWGGADDGAGIAAILEVLRATGASEPLRNDLVVIFASEGGLSPGMVRRELASHPWLSEVAAEVRMDLHGTSGPAVLVDRSSSLAEVERIAMRAVARPVATSALRRWIGDDGWDGRWGPREDPSRSSDVPGVVLTSLGSRASVGSFMDRPLNVSEATLQHHGAQLLSVTRALGGADLTVRGAIGGESRMYFSTALLGLIDYPVAWALLATLALLALYVVLATVYRMIGGDLRRALAGSLLGVVSVVGGWCAGLGLLGLMERLHPEYGRVDAAIYEEGVYLLALVTAVFVLATAGYGLTRRYFSRKELIVGALVVPVLTLPALHLAEPALLVVAQPALALGLVGGLLLIAAPQALGLGRLAWMGALGLGVAIVFAAAPQLELVSSAATLRAAPWLGAALAGGVLLLVPTFEWLVRPVAWLTPAVGSAGAVVLLLLGTPSLRDEAKHPVPTSLVHVVEDSLEVGAAPVYDSVAGPAGGRWVPGRWLTVPGVGETWARSWVVGAADAGSPPPLMLEAEDRWVFAGAGPDALVTAPVVELEATEAGEGGTRVRIRVRPGLESGMTGLVMADGTPGRWTSLDGVDLAVGSEPVRSVRHFGRSEGGVLVAEAWIPPEATELSFDVIEHHYRPAEVLGESFFVRDASVIADPSTGGDRVVQRVRVHLLLE